MNFNDTEKNVTFECEGATDGDLEWFEDFSYCIGGVCQLVLGTLCTKKIWLLKSLRYFSKFLLCTLCFALYHCNSYLEFFVVILSNDASIFGAIFHLSNRTPSFFLY